MCQAEVPTIPTPGGHELATKKAHDLTVAIWRLLGKASEDCFGGHSWHIEVYQDMWFEKYGIFS